MKIISMTDFVLKQMDGRVLYHHLESVLNYAKFLKQPLTLGMFVPCDENDEIVIERYFSYFDNEIEYQDYLKTLELAQSKVLFNDFDFSSNLGEMFFLKYESGNKTFMFSKSMTRTIEDLIPYNLDLAVSF